MTPTFEKNNRIRTIVSNLHVFARSNKDRFWLTREECRLLEEFLIKHRGFFGLTGNRSEQDGTQQDGEQGQN